MNKKLLRNILVAAGLLIVVHGIVTLCKGKKKMIHENRGGSK